MDFHIANEMGSVAVEFPWSPSIGTWLPTVLYSTPGWVLVLSVTHGNPSLEEISLSDGQFGPIYPSLAEIPRVTDSRG